VPSSSPAASDMRYAASQAAGRLLANSHDTRQLPEDPGRRSVDTVHRKFSDTHPVVPICGMAPDDHDSSQQCAPRVIRTHAEQGEVLERLGSTSALTL
jgi:hypothetical protein